MGLIWTPQQRTRQPQQVVRIARSNPLGKTVTHCIPFNGTDIEIVSGAKLTRTNGLIKPTQRGLSLRSNGSVSCASIPLDLSAHSKLSISFLLSWDAYANDDKFAFELTPNTNTNDGGFSVNPNASGPTSWTFQVYTRIASSPNGQAFYIARPTAGVWHHHCIILDRTDTSKAAWYIDGVPTSLTFESGYAQTGSSKFANSTLYLFSRANAALFGVGNLQNLVFRGGYLMSAAEAKAEYDNPYQIYGSSEFPVWFTDAGGGITGTSAIIEGADTATASGLITHLGTSSVTASDDVATAIGYLSHLGTAAVTEGADATSATGRITHTATAAITEGSDTAEATGTVGATSITGTASITEAGDTAAAIGYLSHLGTAAITESGDIAAATGTAGDLLHGFTQDQLDFLVAYMETHMAIPTAAENAAAVRAEIAVELAAVVRSEKWVRNKRTLDPATGMQRIYDDDGATVLGEGEAWLDADGAQPYDGSGAVHRTERLA